MQIVVAHNPQLKIDIKDIRKVRRLGGKTGQFLHNRESNAELGMKFHQTK
jgi:hypothetical protein